MSHTQTIDGRLYMWQVGYKLESLYQWPVKPQSRIPAGKVLTLVNAADETLVIKGEQRGDEIVFVDVMGEGGRRVLGRWIPAREEKAVTTLELIRQNFRERFQRGGDV